MFDFWGQPTVYVNGADLTDVGLVVVPTATHEVQMLDLSNSMVTDAGVEHLKGLAELEWLDLSSTNVTNSALEHLKGLHTLQQLNLRNTKVTDEGVKKLQQELPKCKITK